MTEELAMNDLFDALVAEVGEELDAALPRLTLGNPLSSVGKYVMEAGYSALLAQRRQADRSRMKVAPVPASTMKTVSKKAAPFNKRATEARDELFTSWMLGAVPLGKADKALLQSERAREVALGEGHFKNAQFYAELDAIVPDGKTVSEAVDIRTAHEIRARIYRSSNAAAA